MHSFLVLSGSTLLEDVGDYVYQPTRILQSVADLTEEVRTGKGSDHLTSPVFADKTAHGGRLGHRHHTDIFAFHKPQPRTAQTKQTFAVIAIARSHFLFSNVLRLADVRSAP